MKPAVVGTIVKDVKATAEKGKKAGADMLEIRIDLLMKNDPSFEKYTKGGCGDQKLFDQLALWMKEAKESGLSVIGTVRSNKEGGAFEGTEADRFKLIQKIIPDADYVDIERKSSKKNIYESSLIAQKSKTKIIISSHFFNETPTQKKMENVLINSFEKGADIAKIAVMPKSFEDIWKLYQAGLKVSGKTCLIAMGDIGKHTRITAPIFGSVLSYGYIDEIAAPGQLRVDEIKEGFRILGLIGAEGQK